MVGVGGRRGGGSSSENHNILSSTHSDSTPGSVVRGDLIIGQGSPSATWQKRAVGDAGQVLTVDVNGDPIWETPANSTDPNTVWRAPVLDKDLSTPPGSPSTGDCYIVGRGDVWYNSAWVNRQEIVIESDDVAENVTDLVVTVIVPSGNDVFSDAQADGDDILFTAADKVTKLDHEIEQWVPGSEIGIFRVRVPSVSSSSDTSIYMYYNNPVVGNQENPTGVYHANYGLFYEMGAGGIDSTIFGRNITALVGTPSVDNTVLGLGVAFSNGNAWSLANMPYWEQAWTIRTHNAVFETSADITTRQVILAEGGNTNGFMIYIRNSKIYARWWSGALADHLITDTTAPGVDSSGNISTNTVYFVTASFDSPSGEYRFWVNGVEQDSVDTHNATSGIPGHTGDGGVGYTGAASKAFDNGNATGQYFTGTIAQIEVLDEAWDTNDHVTWYNMLSDNASFLAFGSEQTESSGASGAWATHEDDIAEWNGSIWTFETPSNGWTVYVIDEARHYKFDGVIWAPFTNLGSHDSLSNIQGGTYGPPAEHYHLTQAEWEAARREASSTENGLMPAGLIDLINEAIAPRGEIDSFVTGDWVLDSGYYYLEIVHNLNSQVPTVSIKEGTDLIDVDRVEVVNQDTLRLYVPAEPDLRFNGSVAINKST